MSREVSKPTSMQTWVILRFEKGNLWRQITAVVAPTRKQAILIATSGEANPYSEGKFKALPAKAWGWELAVPKDKSC